MKRFFLSAVALAISTSAAATEIVYQPVNPSFGGNALNGNFLLQKAQSQNAHVAERTGSGFVERFQEALERNIINSITRRIADGEISEGVYDTGEYTVQIVPQGDGSVIVTIINNQTLEETIITMPAIGI